MFSKFCTSQAPSNLPPPRSLVIAVSQLPPSRPPLVSHGVLAVDARPVRQRRAGDDDRPEQLGTYRRQNHDGPSGLAIAYHAGLAVGLGMQRNNLLEENRFGARDFPDGLPRHRFG